MRSKNKIMPLTAQTSTKHLPMDDDIRIETTREHFHFLI